MTTSTSSSLFQFSNTKTLKGDKGDQGIPGVPGSVTQGIAGFPNNAALKSFLFFPMPSRVRRDGFYNPGDGGEAEYIYQSTLLTGQVVDDGAVVQAANGGYWVMDPCVRTPDVRQWGASPAVADSAPFIQAALNAAVGPVLRFSGSYAVGTMLSNSKGLTLDGGDMRKTLLIGLNPGMVILQFSGYGGGMRGIGFGYATTATGGAAIQLTATAFGQVFSDFIINNCYNGLDVAGKACLFSKFFVYQYGGIGIYVHDGAGDVFFSQFSMDAGGRKMGALGGIRLYNRVEAISFQQGDIIRGVYGMTAGSDTNAPNARPAYCNFTDVFFDSSANGNLLINCVVFQFTGCWWACGRQDGTTDPAAAGLSLYSCEALTFTGPRFFSCGADGCYIDSTSSRIVFASVLLDSNSFSAGKGICSALHFAAGTKDFSVIGGTAGNDLYNGGQRFAVQVDPGASDRYVIQGILSGGRNTDGCVFDGGSGTNKLVQGNF